MIATTASEGPMTGPWRRLGRTIVVREALRRVHAEAPTHAPEADELAREYLAIQRADDRPAPDQARRVRALVALAARSSTDDDPPTTIH